MDDLPDIDFKEKKEERKKGFLPWLRSKLGIGGRNAVGGAGEALPGAANFGRAAFGAARFGSSGWLGGLLAGNGGMLFTSAIVAAVLGTGIYMSSRDSAGEGSAAFSSNRTGDSYVPAIMRQRKSDSSLDMFKDANKSKYDKDGYDEEGYDKDGYDREGYDREGYDREGFNKDGYDRDGNPKYDKDGYDKEGYDREGYDRNGYDRNGYDKNGYDKNGYDRNGNYNPNFGGSGAGAAPGGAGDQGAGRDVGRLAGGGFGGGGLSGSLGGGSIGGFGNKPGLTSKVGFGKVGAGFQDLPKFDDRRKKLLAMTGSARPVLSGGGGGSGAKAVGKGSYGQARGVRNTMATIGPGGYTIDDARSTQDKAWEGTTGGPGTTATGGAGVTTGGGKPVLTTQPSIDNPGGGSGGSGAGTGTIPCVGEDCIETPDVTVPDAGKPQSFTEMEKIASQAMTYILLASMFALIGSALVKWGTALMANPYTAAWGAVIRAIGIGFAIAAILAGMYVMAVLAVQMIGLGQTLVGAIYLVGGGLAVLAGISALAGVSSGAVLPAWMAASKMAMYAIALALMGTMLGSSPLGNLGK